MKKSDLRNGAIVETRDGVKSIFLLNAETPPASKFIDLENGEFLFFDEYNEDLTFQDNTEFDIMKVCQENYIGDNIRYHIIENGDIWTWERKEETVMTISEIEEELGITGLKIKRED